MADKQTFETVVIKHETDDVTRIDIPFDAEAVFGSKRMPVKAVINGAEYRGSIVRYGGQYMLGIPQEFRKRAGVNGGDHIVVTIEKDMEPRVVTPPKDLANAMAENNLTGAFAKMSYTHQKEHVRAIEEAKAPQTRTRRIQKAIDIIRGRKQFLLTTDD